MAISTHTTHAIDITDVEYLRHGDKPLLARLHKPRGSGPFPSAGVLWIDSKSSTEACCPGAASTMN
jgi:hypothetical protein